LKNWLIYFFLDQISNFASRKLKYFNPPLWVIEEFCDVRRQLTIPAGQPSKIRKAINNMGNKLLIEAIVPYTCHIE